MAFYVNVGVFEQNKGRVGSRGYQLFRRGRVIHTRWGGIEVTPNREFYWSYRPREKKYPYKSEYAAREAMRWFVDHRIKREAYVRLPAGVKIM
jgi:hypothetical protein